MLDLGLGAGPYLLGYLVPVIGYRGLFVWMVPVIAVSIALYAILVGRRERMRNAASSASISAN